MSENQITLTIPNVDAKQLEKQRKRLHRTIEALEADKKIGKKNMVALEAIANMLDYWSDERHYHKKGRRPEGPHHFAVEIAGCSREQAEQVLRERLGHDEDYGFKYTLNW